MDCPFCQSSIQNSIFAFNGSFSAVYNVAPVLPGHSLIIPNRHVDSILELSDVELNQFILFSRDVTKLLTDVFNTKAFNWSLQEGIIAGQTVAHFHHHIVLRYPDDFPEPGDWYPVIEKNYTEILDSASRKKLDPGEMSTIVKKLRARAARMGLYK